MLRGPRDEENVNAVTHAIGFGLAVAGAVVLLTTAARHGEWRNVLGCAVYATTLVSTYAASTLSHVFRRDPLRQAFRTADQAVIFLFIAGTWTPIAYAWLRGGAWWMLHGGIWAVALAGFTSKAFYGHRVRANAVSVVLYVTLGWSPVPFARPLLSAVPTGLLAWVVGGGLCYTLGTVFFHFDNRVRYFHAAWHVLVIAGSACHFAGILRYCTGAPVG